MRRSKGRIVAAFSAATILLSVVTVFLAMRMDAASDRAVEAENARVDSVLLADELRQSSDDLTNLARLYTATGDEAYRDYFDQTLAIRSGEAPRPEGYQGVFWDFVLAGRRSAADDASQPSSFNRRMSDLAFSEQDFALLSQAEDRSNALAEVEGEAFDLVAAGDAEAASRILVGQEYLDAKASIMEPIDEFQVAVAERTTEAIQDERNRATNLLTAVIALSIALLVTLVAFAVVLRRAWRAPTKSRRPAGHGRGLRMNLRARLLAGGLAVIVVSSLLATVLFTIASNSIETQAFDQLRSVREAKAAAIESEFRLIGSELDTLAGSPGVARAMLDLDAGFAAHRAGDGTSGDPERVRTYYAEEFVPRVIGDTESPDYYVPTEEPTLGLQDSYIAANPFPVGEKDRLDSADEGSPYDAAHAEYHDYFSRVLGNTGFYDLFLINNDGDIVYTVFKEVDFATNLADGPYAESGLGRAWQRSLENNSPIVEDFHPYTPSYNQPAAFFAQAILLDGERIGTLALQAPVDEINDIMTNDEQWESVGLGESGETYIVGADRTMRNDSRFLIEDSENYFDAIDAAGVRGETIAAIRDFNSSIGLQEVDTDGTREALDGEWGEQIFPDYRGVSVLSSYRPIDLRGLDWVIMSEIDEAEAFSAAATLRRVALLTIGGGSLVLFIGIVIASRRITDPLGRLESAATDLAGHDFADGEADFGDGDDLTEVADRSDEIGDLARTFVQMRDDLTRSVSDTLVAVAAREAIEGELNVASEIQVAMLPLTFPKFPEHTEFTIHARLIPAKEIGGDFYEFGFIDDNHFFFCVGDVSGKGVPSALFMAAVKTLIRSGALQGESPATLMTRINSELSRENPEFMFATVWLGVLDLRNGTVTFTNGGHNPPYRINEDIEELREIHGPLVGPIRGATWQEGTFQLAEGETLVVFTDGVTEAMNTDEELFGEERLAALLERERDRASIELTEKVVDEVIAWEQGGRSDDVTVMALQYLSARSVPHFNVTIPSVSGEELTDAIVSDLSQLNRDFGEFADDAGFPGDVTARLQIALDEILVNVASYSGATAIRVRAWAETHRATLEITDDGTPFNILEVPEPDTSQELQARTAGGLGIHMLRELMDEVSYERIGHRNVVKLKKRIEEAT